MCVYGWNPKRRRGKRRRSFSLSPPPFFAAAEEEKLAAMNQDDIGRRHRQTYNFTAARTHKKPFFSFSFSCPHRLSQTLKSIAYRLREKKIILGREQLVQDFTYLHLASKNVKTDRVFPSFCPCEISPTFPPPSLFSRH